MSPYYSDAFCVYQNILLQTTRVRRWNFHTTKRFLFISSNYSFVESDLLQFHCFKILFTFCRPISGQVILISGRLYTKRGGEWYPENSGSRKFVIRSRNLGRVLNESRNLVFLCFFASRILEFLAAGSRRLGFLFVGQRFRSKPW